MFNLICTQTQIFSFCSVNLKWHVYQARMAQQVESLACDPEDPGSHFPKSQLLKLFQFLCQKTYNSTYKVKVIFLSKFVSSFNNMSNLLSSILFLHNHAVQVRCTLVLLHKLTLCISLSGNVMLKMKIYSSKLPSPFHCMLRSTGGSSIYPLWCTYFSSPLTVRRTYSRGNLTPTLRCVCTKVEENHGSEFCASGLSDRGALSGAQGFKLGQ